MKVHQCPPVGYGLTPCCGKAPFELPRYDRITTDPELVTCNSKTIKMPLEPTGERGKETLPVQIHATPSWPGFSIPYSPNPEQLFPYQGAGCFFDWYNDHLQVVVDDSSGDGDPAVHVRYNRDGSIAEIMLRDRELLKKCYVEGDERPSPWQAERDKETRGEG